MVGVMVVAAHLQRELSEVCGRYGITLDQYNVLRILRGVHPEGYPRYEIARRLIDRAPDVTRLLDRLERQGLVERTRAREDRRLSLSQISERGLDLLGVVDPEVLAVQERFSRPIGDAGRASLVRLCDALLAD